MAAIVLKILTIYFLPNMSPLSCCLLASAVDPGLLGRLLDTPLVPDSCLGRSPLPPTFFICPQLLHPQNPFASLPNHFVGQVFLDLLV